MTVHRLPSWLPMAAITLGDHVFAKWPDDLDLLAHEAVHIAQQRRDGAWKFYWRYVTSSDWRVRYEAEAYADDVRRGYQTLERAARLLSGPLYLWPCSFEEALEALRLAGAVPCP